VPEQVLEELEIEEIVSSPDKTAAKDKGNAPAEQASKQVPASTPPKKPSSKRASSKRKAAFEQVPQQVPVEAKPDEPKSKKVKTTMTTAVKVAHFLQRSVVRDKIVKVAYFQN